MLLAGCDNPGPLEKVRIQYGLMHGEVSAWSQIEDNADINDDMEWANLDYLTPIGYSKLSGLVEAKENFILVSKGNSSSCSCWTDFHLSVAKFAKAHHLRIYVIEVSDLEKGSSSFGLKMAESMDEIAIFKEGQLFYSHDDKDQWGKNYLEFAAWMNERLVHPKMFEVDEAQLEDLYLSSEPFFIYFARETCGDCSYIGKTSLRDYLFSDRKIEERTFFIDIDPWRTIVDEQGASHAMNDKTVYQVVEDKAITWGEHVTEEYGKKKTAFGLADSESGFGLGAVPTFYLIHPDGTGRKTDEIINMAGVFYNDNFENDIITDTYFTQERLSYSSLDYLASSDIEHKVLTGLPLQEGTSQAAAKRDRDAVHEAFRVYHEPIFYALLDAAILI